MAGPLAGLLAVHVTWGMPGSIAGMVLSDYGARVVKLERSNATSPTGAVYMDDFLWDHWAEETGRVFAHDHPEHGYVREVGNCLRLSATPALNKGTSARLGQHTREVLSELGYLPADIDHLLVEVCKEAS